MLDYLNTFSYNIDVARVLGIKTAIFLTCINNEFLYQSRNNLLNNNNTMAMTRSEIYARTALDDQEQKDVEFSLQECNILTTKPLQNVPNKNYYIIDYEVLFNIINASDPSSVISAEKASQFIRRRRVEPVSKRQTHIVALKKKINSPDPVIKSYFIDWIDEVYANPKGYLSPKGVEIAQQELAAYCKDNQEKQIAILKIAIKGGLRDMTWAIERYEKINMSNSGKNFANYNDIVSNDVPISNLEVY